MLVIPAIDLKDGQCVRLRQGDMDDSTVFSDDPVATAAQWEQSGARRLHMDAPAPTISSKHYRVLKESLNCSHGDWAGFCC